MTRNGACAMHLKIYHELQQLLSELCDAGLSEADFVRLEELLLGDPQPRRCYIEYIDMHCKLLLISLSHSSSSRLSRVDPPCPSASEPPGGMKPKPAAPSADVPTLRERRRWFFM